ncbi:hypothetical protein HJC99_01825 [Candidatus Saccharibacteria bacterium]|nr:hypothetical protein [Candidatus Saccharibacteria bacterium]
MHEDEATSTEFALMDILLRLAAVNEQPWEPNRIQFTTESSLKKSSREAALQRLVQLGAIASYRPNEESGYWDVDLGQQFEAIITRYSRKSGNATIFSQPSTEPAQSRLITKTGLGQYQWKGQPIDLDPTSLPYKVFDILFIHSANGGLVSYETIERELIKQGEQPAPNPEKARKRIQNAARSKQQGFTRYAKVNGILLADLLTAYPTSIELIEHVRGEGLKINNPIG